MLPPKFEAVDIDYLQALPNSGLRENVTLEFKQAISHTNRMLKEVCAFANTFGGDLLIGVKEVDSVPVDVPGVDPEGYHLFNS